MEIPYLFIDNEAPKFSSTEHFRTESSLWSQASTTSMLTDYELTCCKLKSSNSTLSNLVGPDGAGVVGTWHMEVKAISLILSTVSDRCTQAWHPVNRKRCLIARASGHNGFLTSSFRIMRKWRSMGHLLQWLTTGRNESLSLDSRKPPSASCYCDWMEGMAEFLASKICWPQASAH